MKLPIDVAYEVAHTVKAISKDIHTERRDETHVIALSIVQCNLIADTIAWKRWMVGV